MNGPRVSVIVPVFNAALFLDELCLSIQQQTYSNFEALFFDDGSSDGSRSILEKYATDSRFKIMSRKENRGVMASTLELLGRMRGEFWCHPGADDVLEPRFIEKRLAVVENIPEAGIVHGPAQNIDEVGNGIQIPEFPGSMPEVLRGREAIEIILEHNIINTPSVLVNSSVTREILKSFVGPWRYAQDWFLWILHLATGRPLVWSSERLHRYRVHSKSLTMRPQVGITRLAEIRLVPLCALSKAQHISATGSDSWERWRSSLYALWLRRAVKLYRMGALEPAWMQAAIQAYYGSLGKRKSLHVEILRHFPDIALTSLREARAKRRVHFEVAGIAQVGNSLFE